VPKIHDRYRGALFGFAFGDALGTTLEFKAPGTFRAIADMIGGGPFHLKPGEWTDDTCMALCLGESLIACNGFDPVDQMQRYLRWWQDGYLSVKGYCFDIGLTVSAALGSISAPVIRSLPRLIHSAGNGSLMRLAPVVWRTDRTLLKLSGTPESRTTHGTCRDRACKLTPRDDSDTLDGAQRRNLESDTFLRSLVPESWGADGSYKQNNPPAIAGTIYVSNRWKPRSGRSVAQTRLRRARC
jgi:ADP-ribosyl-[dinitrogen reductase] hydrolase